MRRYFMSIIDFSEIENITADENKLKEIREQMQKDGLLTEKGNPSNAQISALSKQVAERFLYKLSRRIQNRFGGLKGVYDTFQMLEQKKEYTAMYFYLAFLYGFLEWRVPRKVELLSSNSESLKIFFMEFSLRFEEFLNKSEPQDLGDK